MANIYAAFDFIVDAREAQRKLEEVRELMSELDRSSSDERSDG